MMGGQEDRKFFYLRRLSEKNYPFRIIKLLCKTGLKIKASSITSPKVFYQRLISDLDDRRHG